MGTCTLGETIGFMVHLFFKPRGKLGVWPPEFWGFGGIAFTVCVCQKAFRVGISNCVGGV